ncbi:penicillin-binding protein 1C [Rubritalea tangerina]|uniref:peptidoglycan glycosyltransferase n=1 Tax=Rubritalea tangerina TaxID=430798 RepID=A0ABW4Z8H2_9BACT
MIPLHQHLGRSKIRQLSRTWRLTFRVLAIFAFLSLIAWYLVPLAFPLNHAAMQGPPPSILILDRQGKPLHQLARSDHYQAQTSELEGIPQTLIDATLAAEDKRFYQHSGIDPLANLRAIKDSIEAGRFVSGASTISQQTIKLTSGSPSRTLKNKMVEALSARHLEMTYDKDTILAAYFNHLDYGNHCQGPRQSALHYFDKSLEDLSLAQTALLAGLPQAPSRHNPRRNPNNAKKRRDWVLDRMQQVFDYPDERIARAKAEPIHLVPIRPERPPHHLSQLILPSRQIGSHTITSSIDATLQSFCETLLSDELAKLKPYNAHNGAIVIIDNKTREVRAIVGTADFNSQKAGQLNAALTPRSPGSALKPFTYLLAIDKIGYEPSTILADIPTQYAGVRGPEAFVNYSRDYQGPVCLQHALGNSLNTPAVRALNSLGGAKPMLTLLKSLGISTLTQSHHHYGLGLTLGSGEVTLIELTNAYATLANLGVHQNYQFTPHTHPNKQTRIASPNACFLINSILANNLARSANFGANSSLRLPFNCAVKTGTSTDFRDNFCIGFTASFTVGVWIGNLDNTPMKGVSGVTGAGPIFHHCMLKLHENERDHWFSKPDIITQVTTDPHTGKILHPNHPRYKHAVTTYALQTPTHASPEDYTNDGKVLLDDRFTEWLTQSPDNRFVASKTRSTDLHLRILSPARDATYLLDPDLPNQGGYLSLISNAPERTRWECHTLDIENTPHHPTLILEEGSHEVTAIHTGTGKSSTVRFTVRQL